jgi:hypothetical protein
MFGSVVLDVAIGMAFVYLLMSLIASAVQEMLSAFMQLRAANLQRGLRSLFSGDSIGSTMDLVNSVYNHGLVRGLYLDPPRDTKGLLADFRMPLDGLRVWLRKVIGITPTMPITVVQNQLLLPSYIPSRVFAKTMIDILNTHKESGEAAMLSITEALAEHHWKFRDNKAVEALYALALDAKGNVETFEQNLEQWYNDAMDRVSGWYKRYTQRALVAIGLVLAVAFNVSSVKVARTLWLDRDTRQAMVNAADSYMKDRPASTEKSTAVENVKAPVGGDITAVAPDESNPASDDKNATIPAESVPAPSNQPAKSGDLKDRLQQNVDAFNDVTTATLLPVGWKHPFSYYWQSLKNDPEDAFLTSLVFLAGWLLTAFAVSFGAPFWFDTLNRFMVVRSTVKPQEKSTTDKGKD